MKTKLVLLLMLVLAIGAVSEGAGAQIKKKVIKIENKGKQGYLGVEIQDVTKKMKEKKDLPVDRGAYVQNVVEDSPAEEAGLENGDVIVKFGDEAVDDGEELTAAVRKTKPKTEMKIELYRKGEKKTVPVIVGKMKTPQAYSFNLNDDGAEWFSAHPKVPKLSKDLNIRIFSNKEMQGLQLQSLTKQLGEYFGAPGGRGVLISEVEKGSDAEKAGFKAGDVVIKANDRTIDDMDELNEEVTDMGGKEISFEIIRNGKAAQLKMKIEEEDDDSDDEWSDNSIIFNSPGCNQSACFNLHLNKNNMIHLREKLADLKEEIRHNVRNFKKRLNLKVEEM
ncbi:MAG: PDZ domain-containing protein [Ignavibacteriales bacterium]|nr:PDZ domain-containing protein [Ignavibacteriales bacterium]